MSASAYAEMFAYLGEPAIPTDAEPTLVFGRHDELLPRAMGNLATQGLASDFIVSGAYGKDSGILWEQRVPESIYVGRLAIGAYAVPASRVHYEQKALIGTEGARFGIQMMHRLGLLHDRQVSVLAHTTSLRRLAASVTRQSARVGIDVATVYRVPTGYNFDPTKRSDQHEAATELLCLADWGTQGHLERPADLPKDLVAFARTVATTPKHPTGWQLAMVRRLPHRVKRQVMTRGATTAA